MLFGLEVLEIEHRALGKEDKHFSPLNYFPGSLTSCSQQAFAELLSENLTCDTIRKMTTSPYFWAPMHNFRLLLHSTGQKVVIEHFHYIVIIFMAHTLRISQSRK